MAAKTSKNKAARTLILFMVIIVALAGTLIGSVTLSSGSFAPKLAIDLEGGTQLILTPKAIDGTEAVPTATDIDQAIEVIRQRVDASGVAEAEIARNGSENISVGLPGVPSEDTLNLVRSSAVMRFRTVLLSGMGSATAEGDPAAALAQLVTGASATDAGAQQPGEVTPEVAETAPSATETGATQGLMLKAVDPNATPVTKESTPTPTEVTTADPAKELAPAQVAQSAAISYDELMKQAQKYPETPAGQARVVNDPLQITVRDMFIFQHLDCTDPASLKGGTQFDNPDKNLVACDKDGFFKYILGPQVLSGTDVKSAASGMGMNQQGQSTGQWEVSLQLNSDGAKKFDEVAKVLAPNVNPTGNAPDNNRFAIVLDSLVVSAPGVNEPAFHGSASISGSLNRETSATLANQLQFGSLPLNFEVQSEQRISATMGSEHLQVGIYAALIGLLLVVLYLLWQYHALASVATASLLFAALLTYLVVAILSWSMGYRLSLAGVVGLIVAVGVTMDSFIIYFERIRDEVRDGKPLTTAVETGWSRAKRTIVVSDVVNLVAAIVLYLLAVGGVQGFAFTLGLTTVMDLAIIFLFTHPMMTLLVKTRYFGEGRKFSGLDPQHLGALGGRTYVSSVSRKVSAKKKTAAGNIASPAMSLARAKAESNKASKVAVAESTVDGLEPEATREAVDEDLVDKAGTVVEDAEIRDGDTALQGEAAGKEAVK